jgi:uncharacterized protein (DUF433 family)
VPLRGEQCTPDNRLSFLEPIIDPGQKSHRGVKLPTGVIQTLQDVREAMDTGGAYTADRAAALSGVPKRTMYHWARTGVLVPAVARDPMLWSYRDLLGLRAIYWLRQAKKAFDREVPAASMPKIQRALDELKRVDLDPLNEGRLVIAVTLLGEVTVGTAPLASDQLDLMGPFQELEGTRGPDLAWPRPTIQVVPGKLSGEPHVAGTRVPTESLFALSERGFTVGQLLKIYPFVDREALEDSLGLEEQLKINFSLK